MQLRGYLWKYKVTIFFLLAYWILNILLYWHFGNAYISGSKTENKWLVFLAGPFSFSENFKTDTPLEAAIGRSSISPNFIVPFLSILFTEWRLGESFTIRGIKVSTCKSYAIGVIASYSISGLYWEFYHLHAPTTGTSIIAFSITLTYFVTYPAFEVLSKQEDSPELPTSNALLASPFGTILIASSLVGTLLGSLVLKYMISYGPPLAYLVLYGYIAGKIKRSRGNYRNKDSRLIMTIFTLASLYIILFVYIQGNSAWVLHATGFTLFAVGYFVLFTLSNKQREQT